MKVIETSETYGAASGGGAARTVRVRDGEAAAWREQEPDIYGDEASRSLLTDAGERQLLLGLEDRIARPLDFSILRRLGRRAGTVARELLPPDRATVRITELMAGLLLYGISEALMLSPAVGVDPWDVFHTGLARMTGIPVGTVLIIVGAFVLLLWIPIRQRPGLGTLANIVVIGVVLDLTLGAVPTPHALWARWAVFCAGVLLNAVATGLYIGAGLGPGPRDGLTTGFAARGHSIRVVRTGVEVTVLVAGWLLGGNVGLGTVVYAVAIGPLVHLTIPWFGSRHDGTVRPRIWLIPRVRRVIRDR
ncbi:MAG TPA: hypothetical protein VFU73_13565 [Actinocrinis sp.]|nr:hypothetical protein [Actinocrinis sp.]